MVSSGERFLRWMQKSGFEFSGALDLRLSGGEGVVSGAGVIALQNISEGEIVSSIPKKACLTIPNSGASQALEEGGFDGTLGLAIALMYERSKGKKSPWFAYLETLPHQETVPFVWSDEEVDRFLLGTELHETVKQDRRFMKEDWEEHIVPLTRRNPSEFPSEFFSLDCYLAAKSLVASRSFEIDDYHGHGMVPLADLFNHKTAAEDVHIMSNAEEEDELEMSESGTTTDGRRSGIERSGIERSEMLDIVTVKDVARGAEIFNTYGELGNAGLLHRYGFTELCNPYDIVNIDMDCIEKALSSRLSSGRIRKREALWRKAGFSGCESQGCEYFEIDSRGKPERELLMLLFLMRCSSSACRLLARVATNTRGNARKAFRVLRGKSGKKSLLTRFVIQILMLALKLREKQYGNRRSLAEEEMILKQGGSSGKELQGLSLRIAERRILQRCRDRLITKRSLQSAACMQLNSAGSKSLL